MARKFLRAITLDTGLVTGVNFDELAGDDLPLVPGVAGGYTNANVILDQYGRVISAASGSSGLTPLSPDPSGSYTGLAATINQYGQVTAAASGATSAWTQTVNESGASFANLTAASGTWASDGTQIKQTDTAAAVRRAKYNTAVVTGLVVFQADVQIRSAGADRIGGLVVGFDGSGTGGLLVRLNQGGAVDLEVDGVANHLSVATAVAVNTWYTLRAVVAGGVVTAYKDGTLLGSAGNNCQQSNNATYLGLYTYQAEVWFKNVKAYNLTLP